MVIASKGEFLVFEGCEGAGKSTQATNLELWLRTEGREVVLTREPGGRREMDGDIAKIRALLVQKGNDWLPLTELLLFAAARHEHVVKVIKPALAAGKVVICDRFYDSSLAYQGYARGLGTGICEAIRDMACGQLRPDLTFVVDVPASEGLARSRQRATDADRFEQEHTDFHETVRRAFLKIAADGGHRYAVIDGRLPPHEVQAAVRSAYLRRPERLVA